MHSLKLGNLAHILELKAHKRPAKSNILLENNSNLFHYPQNTDLKNQQVGDKIQIRHEKSYKHRLRVLMYHNQHNRKLELSVLPSSDQSDYHWNTDHLF